MLKFNFVNSTYDTKRVCCKQTRHWRFALKSNILFNLERDSLTRLRIEIDVFLLLVLSKNILFLNHYSVWMIRHFICAEHLSGNDQTHSNVTLPAVIYV